MGVEQSHQALGDTVLGDARRAQDRHGGAIGLREHAGQREHVGDRRVAAREEPARVLHRPRQRSERRHGDDAAAGVDRAPRAAIGLARVAGQSDDFARLHRQRRGRLTRASATPVA